MSKQETWLKPRHKVITFLARPVLSTWSRLKYGVTVEPFREQGDRQYLVLINHQTAFDQFFIGMAFRGPVYYLASEDLFSKGFLSDMGGVYLLGDRKYYFISLLVILETMLPFALVFEGRKPKARELVTIAVLCAIGIAGRSLFFMLPQFKPVLALTIIAGVAFGGEAGFLVGAVTMLTSNMLFSQGPWTPWQMFAMGIIGFLAGVLFKKGWLRRTRVSLAVFGAFTAIIIYGGIMNPAAAFMVSSESITLKTLFAYYVTGLPMDLVHAFGTALFIMLAAEPMLEKMDRIKVKYGLVEN